jgi:adenosylcobinamide-phosphate synthase
MEISTWLIFPTALVLDLCLGDPRWLPHPVRFMGMAIERLEAPLRSLPFGLIANGLLFALVLTGGTWLAGTVIIESAALHPGIKLLFEATLIFFCISARSLEQAAMAVYKALLRRDEKRARRLLAMIVGRETEDLTQGGIARAAVETVAENFVDGVAAPLFWAAVGGAPLALAYKMVNTLDSMVGYKNRRYEKFGKAAARLDDVANYLPARLCLPVIALGAEFLGAKGRFTLKTAIAQGHRHTSPNAGYPEAAFAGALDIQLGGPSIYHGSVVAKPVIGVGLGQAGPGHIKKACDLMLLSSILWTASIVFAHVLLIMV